MLDLPKPLVSVEWLCKNLDCSNLVILDATISKVTDRKNHVKKEIEQIKNARFFDIKNTFSNTSSHLPNTFPAVKQFQREARKLGINRDSLIVVYDQYGFYSCARAWWLFKSFGHKNVAVLNGGFPEWNSQNLPIEAQKKYEGDQGNFIAEYQSGYIKNYKQVLNSLDDDNSIILDARASNRFYGEVKEPREGLRSGHIPSSISLPYLNLIDDNKMVSEYKLKRLFNVEGFDDKEFIFTCGSGVTACILALGAEIIGHESMAIYDGSWTEWGSNNELPIETGN